MTTSTLGEHNLSHLGGETVHVPKKWWWVVGIAVPITAAVIAIVPELIRRVGPGDGDTFYVAGTQFTGDVAFNNMTVIVEQARKETGEELPESILEMLRQASDLIKSREFESAIPLLQSAEKAAPVPALYSNLGAAHLATGDSETAKRYLQQAPDEKAARFNRDQLNQIPVNVAALANGARLVSFSTQFNESDWKVANILDGKPNVGWCSADAGFPQTLVVELPGESLISRFSFDNGAQEGRYPGIAAKEVKILVSLEAEDVGYREVGTFTLNKGESAQGFKLTSPVRARWIKLNILSNHGNPIYTELMEFRAIGIPVSPN